MEDVPKTSSTLPFTMNARYLFILFCGTVLLARIPTADAYTVIIQYSKAGNQSQHLQYTHHGNNVPGSEVEKLAFEGVRAEGGINPKIVVSTGKHGYFAIAHSHGQKIRIVGWAGPLSSPEAATNEALANCKKRGGTDPRIHAQWADGMPGKKE
jgi:hypothetical protein